MENDTHKHLNHFNRRFTMKAFLIATLACIALSGAIQAQCCKDSSHKHSSGFSASTTESVAAVVNEDGKQTATILVKDGYHPSRIVLKKGIPVVLTFELREKSCTDIVRIVDLDINTTLTYGKGTDVEFTPNVTGEFTFACPMDMFKGTLLVTQ